MPVQLRSRTTARDIRHQANQGLSGLGVSKETRDQAKKRIEEPTGDDYGGKVVAKEGTRYLVLTASGMGAVQLDPEKHYDYQYDDDDCKTKLAPEEHYRELLKLVKIATDGKTAEIKTAAEVKRDFEEGLVEVWESNQFSNSRVVWRLVFNREDYQAVLNCGKGNQKDICRRLAIDSFHDLVKCQRPYINAAPAPPVETQNRVEAVHQSNLAPPLPVEEEDMMIIDERPATPIVSAVKNEIPSMAVPLSPDDQSMMEGDEDVFNKRQRIITAYGKVIIAKEDHEQTNYALIKGKDEVRIVERTRINGRCPEVFGREDDSEYFSPNPHLNLLLQLAENGFDGFKDNVTRVFRAETDCPELDVEIWLFQVKDYWNETRCDDIDGMRVLRKLKIKNFDALMARINTSSSKTPQSKPPQITHIITPPPSRRSSPQYTSHAQNSSVLPSTEIVTPTATRTTNAHLASDLQSDEYHLIAMHLPMQGQVEKDHTPCIVKGGPYQYELWKWNDVKNHASVKPCAKSQQFHKEDKTLLEHIKKLGGFAKVPHTVITTLTWKRGEDDFINTVMVNIDDEAVRTETLNLRKGNKNNNQGPLQCCISDFKTRGGKESKAIAGIQDNADAKDYLQYREDRKNSKRTRAKSRGLTPFHTDAGDLSRKLSEELYKNLSEQLLENLATFMDEISLRMANLENRYAAL